LIYNRNKRKIRLFLIVVFGMAFGDLNIGDSHPKQMMLWLRSYLSGKWK